MVDNLFLLKLSHAIIYIYITVPQDIDCILGGSLVELVSKPLSWLKQQLVLLCYCSLFIPSTVPMYSQKQTHLEMHCCSSLVFCPLSFQWVTYLLCSCLESTLKL